MKKTVSLLALLLISFSAFSTLSVELLWERSRALNNAATKYKIDITTKQKTIAIVEDTIYLQDMSLEGGLIHCYRTDNGDFIKSISSRTDCVNLVADDAGNLILFGTEGGASLFAHIREANGTFTTIEFGATKKVWFPTIIGDIRTTAYVWTFPTIVSGTNAVVRCYEVENLVVKEIKSVELAFMNSLTGRNHFATPISADLAIINMPSGFTTFLDIHKTYSAGADFSLFVRPSVPVVNALPNQNGGAYFAYKARNYFIQGFVGTSGYKYAGAFKIYDITDPLAVTVVYERTTDLGIEAMASDIMHFQTVVKEDGVYIYQNAPQNGMAAYKFMDDTVVVGLEENQTSSSCYAENGLVKVVAPMGELVELYNLSGQLITSTTTCQPITSLSAANQHIVIVRVAGQVHKVVL